MPDDLDQLIEEIQERESLSAEARNALHGCISSHPWCEGKDRETRVMEALCVLSGRGVNGSLLYRLERLA